MVPREAINSAAGINFSGREHDMTRLFCFAGVVFAAALALGTVAFCKEVKAPVVISSTKILTEANNGAAIKVKVGDVVAISLRGNPTTGYSWLTVLDGRPIMQAVGSTYTPDPQPSGMVGGGGTFLFTFKAAKPGQTQISLAYARPWEKGKPPLKTFAVTIQVG